MKTLRNLALAGTLAIAAALSSGAANAAPASALEIGTSTATESSITPAYYGYYHHRRLCHVPFFKLVEWYGYHDARRIKHRCHRFYYSY